MPDLSWVYFKHKEPIPPRIPTLREVEGFHGYVKSTQEYYEALDKLVQTFTPEQNKLYMEVREKALKCQMLKPEDQSQVQPVTGKGER